MFRLTLAERMRVARLNADRTRRAVLAQALASPMLRWRYGPPVADQILIVPQELRTADPSLWREMQAGQFGLAGSLADIADRSPFDITPPGPAWARALHGFGWLRHLEAAGQDDARDAARRLAQEWSVRHLDGSGIAHEPGVAARRLISWLSHVNLLLEGADPKTYDELADSLGRQLQRLTASWRDAPVGHPRLVALTALVLADLCIAGHDRQLKDAERAFALEVERQILPDGGHISRNPGVLVELMLDFLPLRQCFAARGRPVPVALDTATARMLKMLRFLRLGDGRLARFNGMGVASPAALATVLAYDDVENDLAFAAPASRYARLASGPALVIADVGPPPPLELAGEAHAGALSFEMSVGTHLLIVNGGAPGAADLDWRATARATASHSTLVLDDKSSSRLVRHGGLEQIAGAPPIRGPETVRAATTSGSDGETLEASHDGFLGRAGMLHHRQLVLTADGRRLAGEDRLAPPKGQLRLKRDLPFAIHFHLAPDVRVTAADTQSARLELAGGARWRFEAEGAPLSVEESIHFADSAGPRRTRQLVLRGTTPGETRVGWVLSAGDD